MKNLFLFFVLFFTHEMAKAQIPVPIFETPICRRTCAEGMGKITFFTKIGSTRVCPANPQEIYSCAPYACNNARTTCRTECTDDSQCAAGSVCNERIRQCRPLTYFCANLISANGTDGSFESCFPYTCKLGRCKYFCESGADCAGGYSCSSDNKCVVFK